MSVAVKSSDSTVTAANWWWQALMSLLQFLKQFFGNSLQPERGTMGDQQKTIGDEAEAFLLSDCTLWKMHPFTLSFRSEGSICAFWSFPWK